MIHLLVQADVDQVQPPTISIKLELFFLGILNDDIQTPWGSLWFKIWALRCLGRIPLSLWFWPIPEDHLIDLTSRDSRSHLSHQSFQMQTMWILSCPAPSPCQPPKLDPFAHHISPPTIYFVHAAFIHFVYSSWVPLFRPWNSSHHSLALSSCRVSAVRTMHSFRCRVCPCPTIGQIGWCQKIVLPQVRSAEKVV